jgi:AmmeMemoRadiSam system protein B
MMNGTRNIRPSPIVGTWYSANPQRLKESVDIFIDNAKNPELTGEVIALVAPHAGYQYSGPVAGHAYKTVLGRSFEEVIILSPMHQYDPHPFLTSSHDAYQTPLGNLIIAKDTVHEISHALKVRTGYDLEPVSFDREHSLEIELPFLQSALKGDFHIIPIMLRDQTRKHSKILGEILGELLSEKSVLLVASSDLSHFYTEPIAHQLDQRVLTAIANFSPETLFDLHESGKGQACGLAAIASVLWASKAMGADSATILNYDSSGSITGDHSSVVGYGAAAITKPAQTS